MYEGPHATFMDMDDDEDEEEDEDDDLSEWDEDDEWDVNMGPPFAAVPIEDQGEGGEETQEEEIGGGGGQQQQQQQQQPSQQQQGFPRMARLRCNLTAISQRYNVSGLDCRVGASWE